MTNQRNPIAQAVLSALKSIKNPPCDIQIAIAVSKKLPSATPEQVIEQLEHLVAWGMATEVDGYYCLNNL